MQEKKLMSDGLKALIKLVITLAIFYLIFRNIDAQQVMHTVTTASRPMLFAALILQFLSTLVASYRWYLIMQRLDFGQNFGFYFRSYFKGMFFNQGLPTSIGGDAVRILDVASLGHKKREAAYGVFIDRIVGLLGLLLLNAIASLFRPEWLPVELVFTINVVVFLSLFGVFVLTRLHQLPILQKYKILGPLADLSLRLSRVYHKFYYTGIQVGLSVIIHLFSILAVFSLGVAVGMPQSFIVYLLIVPPVFLLMLIPISLAGWGIREGAMIGLFKLIGAESHLVLSMSILYGVIVLISSLPGLYFFLRGQKKLGREN